MPPLLSAETQVARAQDIRFQLSGKHVSYSELSAAVMKLGRMEAFVRVQNMEFFILEDHRHFAPFKSYKDCMEWINQARDYVKGKNQRKLWHLNLNQNVWYHFH